jgi:hypothetical protein
MSGNLAGNLIRYNTPKPNQWQQILFVRLPTPRQMHHERMHLLPSWNGEPC